MKRKITALFFCIAMLSACSTGKVTGSLAGKDNHNVRLVALLPVDRPADMPRERVDMIRRFVTTELQGKGFVLIDDSIVNSICENPTCPNRDKIAKQYGVDGFIKLGLSSIARANFLAGYVNTVSGNLGLISPQGEELITVQQSERERGGILFNSGQALQAIKSTVANTESDRSFSQLAARYAKELVSKLPPPEGSALNASTVVAKIENASVSAAQNGVDQVCVTGTPQSMAYLVFQKQRSNLREVSSGKYCGLYRLDDLSDQPKLSVELHSPYGDIAERKLAFMPEGTCRPSDPLAIKTEGNKSRIVLECNNPAVLGKYEVYRATSDLSPFEKVADVKGDSWADSRLKDSQGTVYAVVAVNKSGRRTSPVLARAAE